MKICLVTPAPPATRLGNGVTAARWRALFRELGHEVSVTDRWQGEACDLMVALHALRSHESIAAFRRAQPERPLIVVLTGTDLYRDQSTEERVRRSLDLADRLMTLQERGPASVPDDVRAKVRVIEQSAAGGHRMPPRSDAFDVCMLSHLRPVKDCLRVARAARRLPAASRVRISHGGAVLDGRTARAVQREQAINPRYRWLGPLAADQAHELLRSSRALAIPSKLEGGANVVCEALALGVPVLASAVDGNIGLLGEDYEGLYPQTSTAGLARLLARAESDAAFYGRLEEQVAARSYLVDPEREQRLWSELLATLHGARIVANARGRADVGPSTDQILALTRGGGS